MADEPLFTTEKLWNAVIIVLIVLAVFGMAIVSALKAQ